MMISNHLLKKKQHGTYTEQEGYGGVPGWCTLRVDTVIVLSHVTDINIDRLNMTGIVAYLGVVHTLCVDTHR